MENKMTVIALPSEVAEIAKNVSEETKQEVQSVLAHVFGGVAEMRTKLDGIIVIDENDTVNMQLAGVIRLGVKNERLAGTKIFDAKRAEVQSKMIGFKTEDQLWLKASQTMQILTKEIEALARLKEETGKRIESERKEIAITERLTKIQKFNPEITRYEIEYLGESTFDILLKSAETEFNEKIEAEKQAEAERIENIRIDTLGRERQELSYKYIQFQDAIRAVIDLGQMTNTSFETFIQSLELKKENYERAQVAIKADNERLRKESEAKEKQRLFEKDQAERLAEKERIAAKKENDAIELRAKNEREVNERKLKAQQAETDRIKAELAAKELAEDDKRKADELAAKQAASAPDKDKIINAINSCTLEIPKMSTAEIDAIANVINEKFNAFKKWAVSQTKSL